MSYPQRMIETNPSGAAAEIATLIECIEVCFDCAQACRRCESACNDLLSTMGA